MLVLRLIAAAATFLLAIGARGSVPPFDPFAEAFAR